MSAIDFHATGPPEALTAGLSEVLPQMPLLHTFRITNSLYFGAWPDLLRAVLALPYIHTLEIQESAWRMPEEAFTEADIRANHDPLPAIRTFIYHAPFTDCFYLGSKSYGRRDHLQGSVEVANLLVLIELFRSTLEVFEIPAELAPRLINEIATNHSSSSTLFPHLREMRVRGHIPFSGSPRESSSPLNCWQGFFTAPESWAPRLRGLSLQMAAVPDVTNVNHPVLPLHDDGYFDSIAARGVAMQLQSFTLSTPVEHNLVFHFLPESLVDLDLRTYPLPGVVGRSSKCIRTVAPSASQLSVILQMINLPILETLKLSYKIENDADRDGEEALLAHFARRCATLSSIEIHRYRPHASVNSDDDPILPLTRHLSSLIRLRTVLLNLDFPERPRDHQALWNGTTVAAQRRANHKALEMGIVTMLAENIKSLCSTRILSHEDFCSHWNTWDVLRRQGSQPDTQIVELISRGRAEV
ncbi:hypothetical protein V5O48_000812 [Marasmius crinis-equi]|uniref:Uncharacterized protein n=1 Tax=Marasmius crinis-equi TaxID=585013 RepID=A0ABR3G068_9AGAR